MRIYIITLAAVFCISHVCGAQHISINTSGTAADASAMLDLNSGNSGTKGFLPEQVVLTATNVAAPVTSPATGLLVYNTNTAGTTPNNVVPGYYYWNGTIWALLENSTKASAKLPFLNGSSLVGTNYYTSAYTPCSTAPGTPCATAYNFPGPLPTAGQPQSISTPFFWGTYNNSGYTISSNGYFSRAYGWIKSSTTGTVTILAYVYTLTNNSTALSGSLIAQVNVSVTNDGKNYFFEIPSPSTPVALAKGQVLMLWYFPSVSMTNCFSNGNVEVTLSPQ